MESIIFFICFYFIGFVFALMIYDVKCYIKYDGNIINKFNKKELPGQLDYDPATKELDYYENIKKICKRLLESI